MKKKHSYPLIDRRSQRRIDLQPNVFIASLIVFLLLGILATFTGSCNSPSNSKTTTQETP
ncbi:MAG: hypothetical protein PVF74_01475 [Anaerolineales bacterium]